MRATARIDKHPIHPMLVVFPLAGAVLAVITDLVYVFTGDTFWVNASFWLITAAIVGAVLAAIAGVTDFFTIRAVNTNRHGQIHVVTQVLGLVVFAADWGIRLSSRELSGALLFSGVALTIVGALIWLFGAWFGAALVYEDHIGVIPLPSEEERGEEFRRAA